MYLYICTYVYTLVLQDNIYRVYPYCTTKSHAIQCYLLSEYASYTDLRIAIHEDVTLRNIESVYLFSPFNRAERFTVFNAELSPLLFDFETENSP